MYATGDTIGEYSPRWGGKTRQLHPRRRVRSIILGRYGVFGCSQMGHMLRSTQLADTPYGSLCRSAATVVRDSRARARRTE